MSLDPHSALQGLSQREQDVLWLIPARDPDFGIGPKNRYSAELIRLSKIGVTEKLGRAHEDRYRLTPLGQEMHAILKKRRPDWLEARGEPQV